MSLPARACMAGLAAAAVLTGCAGDPVTSPVGRDCSTEKAAPEQVSAGFGEGYKITGQYGIASAHSEEGWLVAVEYTSDAGGGPATGVWFTGDIGRGPIFSVDDGAMAASSWGLGDADDPEKRRTDAGYEAALACLAERRERQPLSDT